MPAAVLATGDSGSPSREVIHRSGPQPPLFLQGKSDLTIEGGEYPSVELIDCHDITIREAVGKQPEHAHEAIFDARQSSDITFEDVDLTNGEIRVRGSEKVIVDHAYIHDGVTKQEAEAFGPVASLSGVYAVAYNRAPTTELVVRDSRFEHLHDDGIFLTNVIGADIEGNYFFDGTPAGSGAHVDTVQPASHIQDLTLIDNTSINWTHGITVSDGTPTDGPDGDNRAVIAEGNYFRDLSEYPWNGPAGVNSLIAHNVFDAAIASAPNGVHVSGTAKSDPVYSTGASFVHNVVKGQLQVAPMIEEDWNVATTPDGDGSGEHDVFGGFR